MALTRLRFTERTTARIIGTIRDRDGQAISADFLTDATLTLYDLATYAPGSGSPVPGILNGRHAQDILGVGSPPAEHGVTLYQTLQTDPDGTTYNFEWLLDAADNAIVTERRQVERHRAQFHFVWPTGNMNMEIEIEVVNLRSVA
jgi:hypothetical protein